MYKFGAREDPVYSHFTPVELKELHDMSDHFKRVAGQVIAKTEALEAKLDPRSRKKLLEYMKPLGSKWFTQFTLPSQVGKRLRSIFGMLGVGPPIFFANHRNDFAEVIDLLTQYKGAANGPYTQLLKDLRFLGRAMRDLCVTPEDLIPLEERCKRLAAHKHWIAPTDFLKLDY
eukprot:Blabericola_migrator_1__3103@NODE_1900_length_3590_cov_37_992052_g1216_i0_p2_GENE_NODE_1900_length_3590_cov_37_992052_g1216_i0NODE_1900_length_3590_cov_37_992052_g1216_i0_p2_ORF_typecomplete_len173_score21_05PC_rep/PF01851_22/4_2e02PC_rep/PF01851_22/2_2_NODE_1900_length_3590_cov_37_992052_g1216_i021952713